MSRDDSWKGEDLIRKRPARSGNPLGGKNNARNVLRAKLLKNAVVCSFAGCEKILSRDNITTVCREHLHSVRCKCIDCHMERMQAKKDK